MRRLAERILARPLALRSGALMATILVLALVILSPFALRGLAHLPGMNWARLSNIGQTYGGVSALLTALALVGVVLSLLYQVRDVNIAREEARRAFHNDLLRMELDDPKYMEALGPPWGMQIATDFDSLRQFNFVHMWVAFWQGRYLLNEMSETEVRTASALELFNSAAGRSYWSASRANRMKISSGRNLEFVNILDQEYNKALAEGPPKGVTFPQAGEDVTQPSSAMSKLTNPGALLCVTAGIVMGLLINRKRSSASG